MAKFKNLSDAAKSILAAGKFKALSTAGCWQKGAIVKITNAFVSGSYVQITHESGGAYNLTLAQFEGCVETKEDLKNEVAYLESRIEEYKSKLAYLNETKQDTFDETEFKVWNTLQLLKGKKNDLEKAKAIAALINS